MNHVLASILSSQTVSDGHTVHPLRAQVTAEAGAVLQAIVRDVKPSVSLEVGLAYGISALFICDALAELQQPFMHIAIDKYQNHHWHGIGLRNLREAGFEQHLTFHEDYSEVALPRLLTSGTLVDFAFIDGHHTFDNVLVDFFFVNRMLRVGGVVVFDDVDYPSIFRVVRHVLTYPAYRLYPPPGPPAVPRSALGRIRSRLARDAWTAKVFHPQVLNRPWEIALAGRMAAVRKVAEDQRRYDWDEAF